jgi:hypothetical protein
MKKSERILLGLTIIATIGLIIFGIYKMFTCEKYKKLRDIGDFPIKTYGKDNNNYRNNDSNNDSNKYDGHRYKQRRRYNFLSQQNRRNR